MVNFATLVVVVARVENLQEISISLLAPFFLIELPFKSGGSIRPSELDISTAVGSLLSLRLEDQELSIFGLYGGTGGGNSSSVSTTTHIFTVTTSPLCLVNSVLLLQYELSK